MTEAIEYFDEPGPPLSEMLWHRALLLRFSVPPRDGKLSECRIRRRMPLSDAVDLIYRPPNRVAGGYRSSFTGL